MRAVSNRERVIMARVRYSSVPNRRAVRNKRAGGKILKKTLMSDENATFYKVSVLSQLKFTLPYARHYNPLSI